MFCTKCGAMVELGHNFCTKCGKQVSNPLPDLPSAPSVPPIPSVPYQDGDDGEETVLYHLGHADWLKKAKYWVPGSFALVRGYIAFYTRSYGKPIRIVFNEIDAISDAYVRDRYACFSVRTRDGRVETFSVEAVETEETQAVIELLRHESGIQGKFDPTREF